MKRIFLAIISLVAMVTLLTPTVLAADCGTKWNPITKQFEPVKTSFDYGCSGKNSGAQQILLAVVNFLAIGVGIAVVGGIIFGAIRYITSNGNAAQAQQGVSIIVNAVIGLLLFMFMYAIINFLVPGGLFN